ncbi:MAG: S8 family serine peptidase [Lysobacteraceae bacterium]
MRFFRSWSLATALLLCGLAASAQPQKLHVIPAGEAVAAQKTGAAVLERAGLDALLNRARQEGQVNVIVTLNLGTSFRAEGSVSLADAQQQRTAIAQTRSQVIAGLAGTDARVNREYETVPAVALRVDEAGLKLLSRSAQVAHISEDALAFPSLQQSVPLIGGNNAWTAGFDGSGWAVAILDTGIDINHAFFRDAANNSRIVAEVCFSNAGGAGGKVSLCPNGSSSQFGAGAANANTSACLSGGSQLCDHGTHVAGISAGYSATRKGVAPNADIIGMQVFTRFNSSSDCSPYPAPCVASYTSDQIAALDYLNSTLRAQHQIASANMSLGGGGYSTYCDGSSGSTKTAIDNLRSNGIATVIATGNGSSRTLIGSPACISTSVAVSSTTKADAVSSFSDVASIMDLFAPGSSISSSIPGGSYASYNGTSMATPHVAGAWAVMKQAKPSASVTEILNAFTTTGVPITDQRSGGTVTKPRIQLDAAVSALTGSTSYTVTPSIGSGSGVISPATPQSVLENNTVGFTLTPALGYAIGTVSGSCGGTLSGNTFQTAPITADCTVVANFVESGAGGDLVCSGPINHSINNSIDGTSVNWITGDIQNADVAGYHFNPYNNDVQLTFWWNTGAPDVAGVSTGPTSSEFRVLQAGDVVGPTSIWSTTNNPGPTAWAAGADGHLGFRFNCASIPDAPVSGICYGYAHLLTTAPTGFPATLVDFCWNKTGSAVVVPGLGTPEIDVTPASLAASQDADTTTSQTLTIANTGTADLNWSIEEAPASRPIALGLEGVDAPMATVPLILDDGTIDNNIGIGGNAQFIFLNRFTPAAGDYPFTLNEVQVYFDSGAEVASVGDAVLLAIYENTSGNADPATGSNLLSTLPVTVGATGAWNTYTLPAPITLNGPGDVLIGVVAQKTPGTAYFPAAIDQTATQQRSWAGWWSTATAPTPPTLPPTTEWLLIDDTAFSGNWMVRGSGETVVDGCTALADVPWLTVNPDSGTTPASGSTGVTVGFDSSGMSPGTYGANLCIASDDPVNPLLAVPVELTVNAAPVTHAITVNTAPAGGGSASCVPNPVSDGGNASCSATAAVGYSFSGWTGDCSGGSCALTNVDGPRTVTANFVSSSHPVTTSVAGSGGSIGPGSQLVVHGGTASGTYAADAGWSLDSLSGSSCSPLDNGNGTWAAAGITSACAITASFVQDPVDGVCGPAHGGTFTSAPVTDLCSVGDAGAVSGDGPWNWTCAGFAGGVDASCSAAIQTYTLTYTAGVGGSVSGNSPQSVTHGGDGTPVTALPDAGYSFVQWSDSSLANPRTDAGVTADISVSAEFSPLPVSDFTPGNIVVYRVGDGSGTLAGNATRVFLDEIDANSGAVVQSIPLPTVADGDNMRCVANGTSSAEGMFTRSTDRAYLVGGCYDQTLGGSAPGGARVVFRVGADAGVDTRTTLTDQTSGAPRTVASTDGDALWVAGNSFTRYANHGDSTSTELNGSVNGRVAQIFDGQLYVSGASAINAIGSGLPTSGAQAASAVLSVSGGGIYGYFFADLSEDEPGLDTLYVAQDNGNALGKFSKVGGVWTQNMPAIGVASDAYRGLTGAVDNGVVTLFATRKGGTSGTGGGELVKLVDTAGYNAVNNGSPVVLTTAATRTAYRGVAFAPEAVVKHEVTSSVGTGLGDIDPLGTQLVIDGLTAQFTVTAAAGWHVDEVTGCGGSFDAGTHVYTTASITAPCDVVANFAIDTHAITVNVLPAEGGNATCTPNPVPHGGDASCSATPAAGYSFAGWSGDCSGASCALANVDGPRAVTATFMRSIHTVTPSVAGGSGTISPDTAQQVEDGNAISFILTSVAGQVIHSVAGSCGGSLAGDTFTTAPVTTDCTVIVHFADVGIFGDGFED